MHWRDTASYKHYKAWRSYLRTLLIASANGYSRGAIEKKQRDEGKAGGDRQELHEKIRVHSMAAGKVVKEEGKANDLLERIAADPAFGMNMEQLQAIMKPENFVGRAPQQTEEFVNEVINPILEENKEVLGLTAEINV